MSTRGQEFGTPFQKTATNATSAVATQTGVAGSTSYITDISGSSDKASAQVLVKDGTTVILQVTIGAGHYEYRFSTPIKGSAGADVSITVDGTSLCQSNMAGYTLP